MNDECAVFGHHVANKLRSYPIHIRNMVQFSLNTVLYNADMGNPEVRITVPSYQPSSYQPPSNNSPSYQPSSYQPPTTNSPSYQPSSYQPPTTNSPSYQPPSYQPLSYHQSHSDYGTSSEYAAATTTSPVSTDNTSIPSQESYDYPNNSQNVSISEPDPLNFTQL